MIAARDLRRDYGRRHALDGVSLDVRAGEVVALLGPNGAGKSTLLMILAGVLRADGGAADVGGLRVPGDERRLGRVVGFVPQGESLYPELSVWENVRLFAKLHGAKDVAARAEALLREARLWDRRDEKAGALSGGLRQRAAIVASLVHDPKVLLLDEPSTGLDPAARGRIADVVRRFAGEDRAVLLSTHSLEEAARASDRVVFLDRGRVKETLPAREAPRLEAAFREAEGDA